MKKFLALKMPFGRRMIASALRLLPGVALLWLTAPMAHADPLKVTPSLAAFKQDGPRIFSVVFAVNVGEKVPEGYAQFVHVTTPGADRPVFQTGTGIETKPDAWTPGQTLQGKLVTVHIPPEVSDGEYELKYGLYHTTQGGRLELNGQNDGQRRYTVGKLMVADGGRNLSMPGVAAVTPAMEGRLKVTPSLTDFSQTGPRAFSFRLVYEVGEALPAGQEVFLHITYASPSPGKDTVASSASGIADSPESWPVGKKTFGEILTIQLPDTVPDGLYTVRTGMYAAKGNGARLKLSGNDDGGRRFIVATIQMSENGAKLALAGAK